MKRSKFSDERILAIVKEGEAGRKVADLRRTNGITERTYYRWKAKYGGMELSEMQRLKQLEDENRRLKHIVAEQTLDIQALKAVVAKSGGPIARREAASVTSAGHECVRRACRLIGLSTATWRYRDGRTQRTSGCATGFRRTRPSGHGLATGGYTPSLIAKASTSITGTTAVGSAAPERQREAGSS